MRAMLITILVSLAAACSAPIGAGGDGRPVLVNRTDNALLYVAFNLDQAGLVDPNPAIDPKDAPERLVAAGAQTVIDLPDYSGEGVLLFIYEIPAQDRAGPVPLSRTVRISPEDLLRAQNRIIIEDQ
jgi:hypothetical protein